MESQVEVATIEELKKLRSELVSALSRLVESADSVESKVDSISKFLVEYEENISIAFGLVNERFREVFDAIDKLNGKD